MTTDAPESRADTLIAIQAARSCDLNEYEARLVRAQHDHEQHQRALVLGALVFFTAGLAGVYLEVWTGAVALLALSAALYQMASHHRLLADMADAQWSLALLINRRATPEAGGE